MNVVQVAKCGEYMIEVIERGSGYAWRLCSPALTAVAPSPSLESLQIYLSVDAAIRAAKAEYEALDLVFV